LETQAEELGLKITRLENDQTFQDFILSVFHTTTITFNKTSAVKIIENHLGKAFVKQERQLVVDIPQPRLPQPPKNPPVKKGKKEANRIFTFLRARPTLK
jgi:hypothetical protein